MPGAGNNPHIYTTQRIKQITDTQAVTTSKEGPKAETTITVPASTQELVGVKSVNVICIADWRDPYSASGPLDIETLDTTSYSDRVVVNFKNTKTNTTTGAGVTVYPRKLIVTGFPVKRLFGSNGGIKIRDMVDRSSIARNGENAIEIQNQWINSQAQCEDVADHLWKINRRKHLFAITFDGIRPWYEVGTRYDMTVEYSLETGDIINIDSVCQVISCEYERSVDSYGQTVVVFKEIDQSWEKTNQVKSNYVTSGSIPTQYAYNKALYQLTKSFSDTALLSDYTWSTYSVSAQSVVYHPTADQYEFQYAANPTSDECVYTADMETLNSSITSVGTSVVYGGKVYKTISDGVIQELDSFGSARRLYIPQIGLYTASTVPVARTRLCGGFLGDTHYLMAGGYYIYSTNGGASFSEGTLPASSNIHRCCFGNNILVAVGSNDVALYKTQSGSWTSTTMPSSSGWYGLAYGNGIFVAVGETETAYSYDGVAWYSGGVIPTSSSSLTFFNGWFIVACEDGVAITDDAITWTSIDLGKTMFSVSANEKYVFAAAYDGTMFSSTDGQTFQYKSTTGIPASGELKEAAGLIIYESGSYLYTTFDGVTWETTMSFTGSRFIGVLNGVSFIQNESTNELLYSHSQSPIVIASSQDSMFVISNINTNDSILYKLVDAGETAQYPYLVFVKRDLVNADNDTWSNFADDDGTFYSSAYRYNYTTDTATALGLTGSPWYCGSSGGRPHFFSSTLYTIQRVESDYSVTTIQLPDDTVEAKVSDSGIIYTTSSGGLYTVFIKLAQGEAYRVFRKSMTYAPQIYLGKRAIVAYAEDATPTTLVVEYSQEV